MQRVVLIETPGSTVEKLEIICESWSSWRDGDYMCFLFLDVQASDTQRARRTLRHTSRVVETVTSERVESWVKSGSSEQP